MRRCSCLTSRVSGYFHSHHKVYFGVRDPRLEWRQQPWTVRRLFSLAELCCLQTCILTSANTRANATA
jgi:hypothetical protein